MNRNESEILMPSKVKILDLHKYFVFVIFNGLIFLIIKFVIGIKG